MQNLGHEYRPATTLSWLAIIGLALQGLCASLSAIIGVGQVLSPGSRLNLDENSTDSVWLLLQGLAYLLLFPVYIFTIIVFLMWLHRVTDNLLALRADNIEYSPGWAVGWWFVPLFNLIRPFQVVRNVWNESDPDVDQSGFLRSVQAGAPAFMVLWWVFWLVSNFAANITSRIYDPDDTSSVQFTGYFFLAGGILTLIAALLAIKVVRDITLRQESRWHAVRSMFPPAEPPPPPVFPQP